MNPAFLFPFLILLGVTVSCRTGPTASDEVVCETYIHRYGVPLDAEEWSQRGQDGQVTSVLKDGVAVTRSYEGGVLEGETFYTFPYREMVQKRERYQEGQLVLECSHDSNGLPVEQREYHAPGSYQLTRWYESGAPQCREAYEGERLLEGEYYDVDYQLESRVEKGEGERLDRNGGGELQAREKIQGGERVQRVAYHPNGVPAAVNFYENQKIEGERHTFLPDGEPATIEHWTQDAQHGETTLFEYGEKRAEVPYVKGKRQGVERRYRGDEVVQEIHWVDGQRQGPTYTYGDLGDSPKVDWYFKDQRVANKATYDVLCNQ